jgi:CRP-like cAMP-binding protein
VEQAGMVRRFPRGDALFHQGDDPGMVLIIHSGRIKVSVVTPDGHDVMLGYLQPGTVLGDLAALDGEPRSTTAIAIDAVEALGVPMLAFRRLLDERPGIMRALALIAAQRLRLADRQRVEFAAYDVLGRVARRIDELAESGTETAEGIEIDGGLTRGGLEGPGRHAHPGLDRDAPARDRRARPRRAAPSRWTVKKSTLGCGARRRHGAWRGVASSASAQSNTKEPRQCTPPL